MSEQIQYRFVIDKHVALLPLDCRAASIRVVETWGDGAIEEMLQSEEWLEHLQEIRDVMRAHYSKLKVYYPIRLIYAVYVQSDGGVEVLLSEIVGQEKEN